MMKYQRSFFNFLVMACFMFVVFIGGVGCGGSGSSSDFTDENTPPPEKTSFIVTFDSNGGTYIASQEVASGEMATMPEFPEKENNLFIGWYTAIENDFSFKFNFKTPIVEDITLHAKWYDTTDTTDSDGDGLVDSLEFAFGTDPFSVDTDEDGLSDFDELNWLNYNPLIDDTNGNGIYDGDEDPDNDGLTNVQESNFGTNMILVDTDRDGLTDYEEIQTYGTNPLNQDTDGDGVDDGIEVAIGSDPLVAETKFTTSLETSYVNENPEAIDISVEMESSAESAGSLFIHAVNLIGNPLISSQMPGFLNAAYEITANSNDIQSATLTFTLGSNYKIDDETFKPAIYYLNEEEGSLEKVENQTINGNKVSVKLTHFSVYILLNSIEFDRVWSNDIRPTFANASDDNIALDIVFVIDYSLSMAENDSQQIFKPLTKNFINKLRDNKDRAAIIKFIRTASVISNFTTDKNALNNAIDSIVYDNGVNSNSGTNGSEGLNLALNLFTSSSATYRYIVFITDGGDNYWSYSYDSLIQRANDNNVVIYTIGMGTADEDNLKHIAESTKGKYYYATTATNTDDILKLDTVFDNIENETINIIKDSNGDLLSDYYTDLILNGSLTLEDGTTFLMAIPEESKDLADWDGDGLLNGEEIYVKTDSKWHTYVVMKSNPLVVDTDEDTYSDYDEVKKMKTSPLKTTWPKPSGKTSTTLGDVRRDDIFPPKYLELSKQQNGFTKLVQDMASFFSFDFEKVEASKKIFIEYFSDYATGEILSRDAEVAARQAHRQNMIDGINMGTSFLKFANAATNLASNIQGGKYDEDFRLKYLADDDDWEEIKNELVKKLEKRAKLIQKAKTSMRSNINRDLAALDRKEDILEKASAVREGFEELQEDGQLTELVDLVKELSEDKSVYSKVGAFVEDVTILINCAELVINVLHTFDVIKIKPTSMSAAILGNKVLKFRNAHTTSIAVGLTLVLDIADMAVSMYQVAYIYGQIEANFAEYYKNIEILNYISENALVPEYARNGAHSLLNLFLAENPNWSEFNRQIENAKNKQIKASVLKTAFDGIFAAAGTAWPAIGVVKLVFDFLKAQFIDSYIDVLFAAQVYYALVDASSTALVKITNSAHPYFDFDREYTTIVENYLKTLVQARIVGLNDVAEYIIGGNVFKKFWNLFGGYEEDKTIYREAIRRVYEFLNACQLEVSDKLPGYYTEYNAK